MATGGIQRVLVGAARKIKAGLLNAARSVARFIWLGSVVVTAIVALLELLHWLKFARWPAWTVGTALDAMNREIPNSSWAGVQKIIDAALGLPFIFALPVAGIILSNLLWQTARLCMGANRGAL